MTIDVIITTCNRADRASLTIFQLQTALDTHIQRIILIDSGDKSARSDYPLSETDLYVWTSHKNQPFQRYLGYSASDADLLLYLDDDMDLLDPGKVISVLERILPGPYVGMNFSFRNDNRFLQSAPKSVTAFRAGKMISFAKWLSGSPSIKENRLWFCGLRGRRLDDCEIDFVHGGVFAARRDFLYKDFNFQLFDYYEHRLGKGEDAVIGYCLSRQGPIWAAEGEMFYHNDQEDSSYTVDLYSFNRRVACSRLFLSLEFERLSGRRTFLARLHYQWYMLWRTAGLSLSLVVHPNRGRWDSVRGWLAGWWCALMWKPRPQETAAKFWLEEVEKDLNDA
ncbi:hypothetical protein N9B33_03915 [Akkermansiaceae bacterium]|nr:hypothetical protein [Akkermansiaceae bacterium]MDB4790221.1 hypothetical protein [Akkermansiaceae bacterium]